MIPDRWQLRKYGKYAYGAAVFCFVVAAILERVEYTARRKVEMHERLEHDDEPGEQEGVA